MSNTIKLKEGFEFKYDKNIRDINFKSLKYKEYSVAENWMELSDFIITIETGLRNKLGTKKKYLLSEYITIYGKHTTEFIIHVDIAMYQLKYDLVQAQQLVAKLTKLLNIVNKLHNVETRY